MKLLHQVSYLQLNIVKLCFYYSRYIDIPIWIGVTVSVLLVVLLIVSVVLTIAVIWNRYTII